MFRNAYVLLLLTTLFWGGNSVAGKLAVGHVSPMLFTTMRWAFAAALLVAIGWPRLRADWPVVRKHIWVLASLGALGFTVFNAALYTALNFTTAINTSIEQAGMPMLIFAANFLLFRMRVAPGQILGFLLSLLGVALTASHGNLSNLVVLDLNFGDALMLVAVLVYSAYTVALRFKPDIHWQSLMIMLAASAFVTSIPFTAWEIATDRVIAPDLYGWALTAYVVVFPSIMAQMFYIRGVELIGANRAGLFINMVPIFGTLLSVLILGEDFQLYHALAIALVFGGIWLAEHSGRKMASAEELMARSTVDRGS
ncbi:DMT family transporter [Aminobacter niigataensis]|uniref:DMT family transporter n=1 Tax=Aminobacter niigataensis TaxID=83265 RepID=UPI0024CB2B8B|nr:DMT family transporter [Aminobacter niigataensis]CAI2932658.1 Carboxylate/amino acid/amine transporter [Aminobacter niigataensis]